MTVPKKNIYVVISILQELNIEVIDILFGIIGDYYEFKNKEYILEALTHSSYSNENKNYPFNERLEFLGDSVLSIVISDYLFKKETKLPEGELTKLRANIVCEESLSEYLYLQMLLKLL